MNCFFRASTHLVSMNRLNYTLKRVQTTLKHYSTFFRLIVKTGFVNIVKDFQHQRQVSVAHWCGQSTETLPVFGSNLARCTLFFIFITKKHLVIKIDSTRTVRNRSNWFFTITLSTIFSLTGVFLKEFVEVFNHQPVDKPQKRTINLKFEVEKVKISNWLLLHKISIFSLIIWYQDNY